MFCCGAAHAAGVWPDTDQDKCYDIQGQEITCGATGSNDPNQDADFRKEVADRFIACTATATVVDPPDGSQDVVVDTVTDLMWEVKKIRTSGTTPTDKYNPTKTFAMCTTSCSSSDPNTYDDFIADMNGGDKALFGNFTDWALPTVEQLLTLVRANSDQVAGTTPAIDAGYFPNTQKSDYWTQSLYADGSGKPWYVNFTQGESLYTAATNSKYARAVRPHACDQCGSCL